jgi:hypothetical protein
MERNGVDLGDLAYSIAINLSNQGYISSEEIPFVAMEILFELNQRM